MLCIAWKAPSTPNGYGWLTSFSFPQTKRAGPVHTHRKLKIGADAAAAISELTAPGAAPRLDTLLVRIHHPDTGASLDEGWEPLCHAIDRGELPPTITRLGALNVGRGHWEQLAVALRSPTASTRRLRALQLRLVGVWDEMRVWWGVGQALFRDAVCPALETLILRESALGVYGLNALLSPIVWPGRYDYGVGWVGGPDVPGEDDSSDFEPGSESESGSETESSGSESEYDDEAIYYRGSDDYEEEGQCAAVRPVPCIRELDLAECGLGDIMALVYLADAMGCRADSPLAQVQKLDVHNNSLGYGPGLLENWVVMATAGKNGWASHLTHLGLSLGCTLSHAPAVFGDMLGQRRFFSGLREVLWGGEWEKEIREGFDEGVEAGVRAIPVSMRVHLYWWLPKRPIVAPLMGELVYGRRRN
jgi:hypothetical protein